MAVVPRTVEEMRRHMGFTQARMAALLGMPRRTYEDKVKRGFREVDRMATCWVFYHWCDCDTGPFDERLEAEAIGS